MPSAGNPARDTGDRLRLDRWLWCARFYRTRNLAQQAVAGGRVHLNGERVKAAHAVRIGDVLELTRDQSRFRITVLGIPPRRGPAREMAAFFSTEILFDARSLAGGTRNPAPPARPGRQDRRRIRQLQGRD